MAIGAGQDRRFDAGGEECGVYLDLDLEEKGDPVFKLKLKLVFDIKRSWRSYLFLSAQRDAI